MGAWGPAIFSDDTALDVREEYTELIRDGIPGAEATRRLVGEYRPDEDPDDGPVFWLALAAVQWKLGRLEDEVRDRALGVIQDGSNLRRWEDEASAADVRKRRAALEKLRDQLHSPQPPPKPLRPKWREWSPWEVGDVVSYRLLSGRLILLRVTGHDGDRRSRSPEVEIVDWEGEAAAPAEEIARLEPRRPLPERGVYYTRNIVARASKADYPAARIELVARGVPVAPLPRPRRGYSARHPDVGQRVVEWWELDTLLRDGFGLE